LGRRLSAEFVGTFWLVLGGCGSAVLAAKFPDVGIGLLGVALAFGLTVLTMAYAFGHVSGGHFNPAVTLSMIVTGRIEVPEAVRYWVSQLAGGTAAALVLLAIFPSVVTDLRNLGTPAVAGHGFSTGNALVAEIVGTFFLVFVIYGVAVDKRGAFSILAGLPIGLTISIGVLALGVVSGAAVNPARWFGPALVSGTFDNFWVWILGPAIGGVLAGLVYDRLLLKGTAGE
jgi:MIP family channel proteins